MDVFGAPFFEGAEDCEPALPVVDEPGFAAGVPTPVGQTEVWLRTSNSRLWSSTSSRNRSGSETVAKMNGEGQARALRTRVGAVRIRTINAPQLAADERQHDVAGRIDVERDPAFAG